jgi:hypothetical protein
MSIRKGTKPGQKGEARFAEAEVASATDAHTPRKMTVAENAIFTVKLLVVAGLLGAVLWGIDLWNAAR